MLSKIWTASIYGLDVSPVSVETDVSRGSLPVLNLTGLPDQAVREARERVRSAILNSGYAFPLRRITINLSPANTRKEGSHFDLPMALGVLTATGAIPAARLDELTGYAFLGELSLDGRLNPIQGALPLCIGLRDAGVRRIVLPEANAGEACRLPDVTLYPAQRLSQIAAYFGGRRQAGETAAADGFASEASRPLKALQPGLLPAGMHIYKEEKNGDYQDVAGQETAKRALTVCAAGMHGIFLFGFPGSGKTMLARRLPSILPALTYEESLEVTKIYSVAGALSESRPLVTDRPFRSPHHSISSAALIGGGPRPKPGELSLAHRGVLFLDEFPEFSRSTLELLRQPMEEGKVTIGRAAGTVTFPGRIMLVAASNPCPCGYHGDETHSCTCSQAEINRYLSKLSGPVLDRIDMHIEVTPVRYGELQGSLSQRKSSAEMKAEVAAAAAIQRERYRGEAIDSNAQLTAGLMKRYCALDSQGEAVMAAAFERLSLSARSHGKVLKVARTIADLAGEPRITAAHLTEALRYRCLDRLYKGGANW